jgi:hypothetical protein
MRGRYPVSEQYEPAGADTAAQPPRPARAGLVDLLAFLGVLVFAGGLALLVDRTGQLSARLALAGAAGLVAACVTAWRRLRRIELRRWRSGQAIYRGRRVTLVSAWGVEGRPPPAIEPPVGPRTTTPSAPMPSRADAGPVRAQVSRGRRP